jgi:hypothetical protein
MGKTRSKVKAVYDNGGKSYDRYTVYYSHPKEWGIREYGTYPYVAMNDTPYSPLGFCQHGEGKLGRHNGKRIDFYELPTDCQKVVRQDLKVY